MISFYIQIASFIIGAIITLLPAFRKVTDDTLPNQPPRLTRPGIALLVATIIGFAVSSYNQYNSNKDVDDLRDRFNRNGFKLDSTNNKLDSTKHDLAIANESLTTIRTALDGISNALKKQGLKYDSVHQLIVDNSTHVDKSTHLTKHDELIHFGAGSRFNGVQIIGNTKKITYSLSPDSLRALMVNLAKQRNITSREVYLYDWKNTNGKTYMYLLEDFLRDNGYKVIERATAVPAPGMNTNGIKLDTKNNKLALFAGTQD